SHRSDQLGELRCCIRLLQETGDIGTPAEALARYLLAVAARHDHRHIRTDLLDFAEGLLSAEYRHRHIEQHGDDGLGLLAEYLQRASCVLRQLHSISVALERRFRRAAYDRFIIHY